MVVVFDLVIVIGKGSVTKQVVAARCRLESLSVMGEGGTYWQGREFRLWFRSPT